jgi:thiaminase
MPERFTETLRTASEAGWSHAVQHRFVNELFAGAVPDAVMARYLIQDHRFLDSFLVLLGFRGFVDFLRTELDRVGPAHADLCRDFFSRAVALELSFFEAAYTT